MKEAELLSSWTNLLQLTVSNNQTNKVYFSETKKWIEKLPKHNAVLKFWKVTIFHDNYMYNYIYCFVWKMKLKIYSFLQIQFNRIIKKRVIHFIYLLLWAFLLYFCLQNVVFWNLSRKKNNNNNWYFAKFRNQVSSFAYTTVTML